MQETSNVIHITGIQTGTTHEEIAEFLKPAGKISKVDFIPNTNKANVVFVDSKSTDYCLNILNHSYYKENEIKISRYISSDFKKKIRPWKLKIENIPIDIDVYQYFSDFGPIHQMSLHFNEDKPFAHLQYYHESSAKLALEDDKMKVTIKPKPLIKFPEGSQIMEITGLPEDITEDKVMELVRPYGQIKEIYMNQKLENKLYTFVNFGSRRQRKAAISALDGKRVGKCTIHAGRLLASSPFQSGKNEENDFFRPKMGKYYIEFVDPPDDLDEQKLRTMCAAYGTVYEVSIGSKCNGIDYKCSHVGFSTKGQMRKALAGLSKKFNVKRLPKSSPFFQKNVQ
ncbi:Pab1p [Histomonas meleagridis]|uniref:Pab1p n=1 Tax=Histomonas meleagridis TaxID=135588 RepID=UPI00355A13A1|nr:Pab1p [Histomonas meleagridis]KAH0803404.1 Pab1p [Histomonas meleagridis]